MVRTFQAGDISGYGEVGPAEFDEMIECAAQAPRRFGLAPKTEDMFKSKGVKNDSAIRPVNRILKILKKSKYYLAGTFRPESARVFKGKKLPVFFYNAFFPNHIFCVDEHSIYWKDFFR